MEAISFDTLGYFEKLKHAGVPEEQAKVQADTLRDYMACQDEKYQRELATKGDLRETELRLLREIEQVRAELKTEIAQTKYDLLKWQIGGWIGLAAIMAKGFGWLGF